MTTDYRRMNGGIVGLPKGRTAELLEDRKDEFAVEKTNWTMDGNKERKNTLLNVPMMQSEQLLNDGEMSI